jgi:hypothetical protein
VAHHLVVALDEVVVPGRDRNTGASRSEIARFVQHRTKNTTPPATARPAWVPSTRHHTAREVERTNHSVSV